MMIAFVFVLFFAPSVEVLVVGEILCGMRDASLFLLPAAMGGILLC